MQEYLQRSRLGQAMDGLGFHAFTLILSNFWFILLWGLGFPAVVAGAALYVMIVILRKKARDDHVTRKEKQLRATIGGELALERLLLTDPAKAHFEITMLLSMRESLTLIQAGEKGVLCARKGKKWIVSFLQSPQESGVGPGDVLSLQREIRLMNADRGLLCACGKISAEARRQAEHEPPVSFFPREKLIAMLGSANPATDPQLIALGRRRKKAAPVHWLRLILAPSRGKRYACYGALLLGMYQLNRLLYFGLPGLACVFLAAACRCVRQEETAFMEGDDI
ncbi:MAG: hypothetical protein IKH57_17500 [Clostridia bacterium]|nr:hypothetical protein [Clostridia bacterium]